MTTMKGFKIHCEDFLEKISRRFLPFAAFSFKEATMEHSLLTSLITMELLQTLFPHTHQPQKYFPTVLMKNFTFCVRLRCSFFFLPKKIFGLRQSLRIRRGVRANYIEDIYGKRLVLEGEW